MYSMWKPAPGVGKIRMKEPRRYSPTVWYCNGMAADEVDDNTWAVWDQSTGLVAAIFYGEPNVHGWSPPEAHAKSYLNRYSTVNPFDLDNVP